MHLPLLGRRFTLADREPLTPLHRHPHGLRNRQGQKFGHVDQLLSLPRGNSIIPLLALPVQPNAMRTHEKVVKIMPRKKSVPAIKQTYDLIMLAPTEGE